MKTCNHKVGFPVPHTTHHIYQKILSPPPSEDSQIFNLFTTATITIRMSIIIISCLVYPISLQNDLLLLSLPFQYILNTVVWKTLFNVCHFRSLFCSKTQQNAVIPWVKDIPKPITIPIKAFMICHLLSLFSPLHSDIFSVRISLVILPKIKFINCCLFNFIVHLSIYLYLTNYAFFSFILYVIFMRWGIFYVFFRALPTAPTKVCDTEKYMTTYVAQWEFNL